MTTNQGRTAPNTDQLPTERSAGARRVWALVCVLLGLVILAPIILSSQDLYAWGRAPRGLNLGPVFAAMVPVALDLAAAACIGMVIISTWRGERGGVFTLLVWVFAGVSAFAQVRHGIAERDAGRAQDAWWAMPGFALLGPLLLECTLSRLRRWLRQESGEQASGAAGFGSRWLPGIAFRETLRAWATSRREGINGWRDAVQFVRDCDLVRDLVHDDQDVEAVRYAYGALGAVDPHAARVWLAARGVRVDQQAFDDAAAGRPVAPPYTGPAALAAVPVSPAPAGSGSVGVGSVGSGSGSADDLHAVRLAACGTKRDRIRYAYSAIGRYDQAAALRWLADRGYTVSKSECHAVIAAASSATPTGEYPVLVAAG